MNPFQKTVNRTGTEKITYLWNNAYQNLKHDRANSLSHGNVEALFEILAALFILNLYFSNIRYELGKDSQYYLNFSFHLLKLFQGIGGTIFEGLKHNGLVFSHKDRVMFLLLFYQY